MLSEELKEEIKEVSEESNFTALFGRSATTQTIHSYAERLQIWSDDHLQARKGPHWLIDNPLFGIVVTIAIAINAIQIGLSADYRDGDWETIWNVMEGIFTAIFTLELTIKLACLRGAFFTDKWNVLDIALVTLAAIDLGLMAMFAMSNMGQIGSLTVLRVLRLCRVVRIVRMFKLFRELVVLIDSIMQSMRTMGWLFVLLIIMIYIYAVAFVELIGRDESYPDYNATEDSLDKAVKGFNNYQYFGTVTRAMNTLFSLITLSEWSTISRPIFEQQPHVMILFYVFTMTTTFGVMNVVIGVMVEHALDAAKDFANVQENNTRTRQMRSVAEIEQIIAEADTNSSGTLQLEEMKRAFLTNPAMAALLRKIDLPQHFTIVDLFYLIDEDGDGEITLEELWYAMKRLVYCSEFQRLCLIQMSINKLSNKMTKIVQEGQGVIELRKEMVDMRNDIGAKLDRMMSIMNTAPVGIAHDRSTDISHARDLCNSAITKAPLAQCQPDLKAQMPTYIDDALRDSWERLEEELVVSLRHTLRQSATGQLFARVNQRENCDVASQIQWTEDSKLREINHAMPVSTPVAAGTNHNCCGVSLASGARRVQRLEIHGKQYPS